MASRVLTGGSGWITPSVTSSSRLPVSRCPPVPIAGGWRSGNSANTSTTAPSSVCGKCRSCHFIWADVRLDSRQIRAHFEWTYKGDEYFLGRRRAIFEHMVKLIDQAAPPGGTVLDVGGAQGHLMRLVAERRPDLTATVCDVSAEATRYASEQFGLPVLCADLTALKDPSAPLTTVVVLSDVLYYEPQLAVFWATLPRLVANRGCCPHSGPQQAVAHSSRAVRRSDPCPEISAELSRPGSLLQPGTRLHLHPQVPRGSASSARDSRRCARFPHPSCPPDLAGEKSADPRSSHWQRPLTPSLAIGWCSPPAWWWSPRRKGASGTLTGAAPSSSARP